MELRRCLTFGLLVGATVLARGGLRGDDWPQWRGPRRDAVWRETGIVEKLSRELTFRWRQEIGAGYCGPAVAGGRVFVMDRILEKGENNPENPFSRRMVKGKERVLCLDESDGRTLWTHEYYCKYEVMYPSGPRATPTVDGGKVYTVGAMGNLFCLDVEDGKPLWSKDYVKDYSTEISAWGVSSAPLIDGEKLILIAGGEDEGLVMALDKTSGKEIWRSLYLEDPGYAPPVIVEAGGKRQLIVWTPAHLNSLDLQTGEVYWRQPFAVKSSLSIATPIFDEEKRLLFVTSFYNGPMMMRLDDSKPRATMLWRGTSNSERENKTEGLHAIMCTPFLDGGYIYGVCSYGQLRCLNARTGERIWETREATGDGRWWNAFLVRHEDRYFLANEQGELITARLTPKGYEETSRAFLIAPTNKAMRRRVVWSHPAFAGRHVYARNDREIVCADLSAKSE